MLHDNRAREHLNHKGKFYSSYLFVYSVTYRAGVWLRGDAVEVVVTLHTCTRSRSRIVRIFRSNLVRAQMSRRYSRRVVIVPCSRGGSVELDVTYTNDPAEIAEWLAVYAPPAESYGVHGHSGAGAHAGSSRPPAGRAYGLDAEWRPVYVSGEEVHVSVLQICSGDSVLVVQINDMYDIYNDGGLGDFLSRPSNTFVGMGTAMDLPLIYAAVPTANAGYGMKPQLVDLKRYGQQRGVNESGGLSGLAGYLLGVKDWKERRVQMSDWSAAPLTSAQVAYAATDAWTSLACYYELSSMGVPAVSSGPGAAGSGRSSVMTMDEFHAEIWSVFGGRLYDGVQASEVGSAIPRATWPAGYNNKNKKGAIKLLAEAIGLRVEVDFHGHPVVFG